MSAADIARALGGHRAGRDWTAPCPAHADSTPSLAIREGRDGKVLLKCHAGCTQWEVIRALRDREIWSTSGDGGPQIAKVACADVPDDEPRRKAYALQLWSECIPAKGTPVETYLQRRGLCVAVPDSIRFHPALKHPSGAKWPSMVGLVTNGVDASPIGIHRTFLARDGSGKAPVTPVKMMLGPCRGGVIRLGAAADTVMVGEGVETCLAVMQATGSSAWAALSTSGLRAVQLPAAITTVVVLADGDGPGEAAAVACARRLGGQGRSVTVARPPAGKDFNDVLLDALRAERSR